MAEDIADNVIRPLKQTVIREATLPLSSWLAPASWTRVSGSPRDRMIPDHHRAGY